MATIARLIVAMGADPAGLRRGLNSGVNEIRQFARSAAQIGNTSNIFGNLDTPAKRAAHSAVAALKETLARELAVTREQLANQVIDEKEFTERGRAAAVKFNTGLRQEIDNLGAQGSLTAKIHAGLVGQFITIGDDSGSAFARGFSRATSLLRSVGLATRRIGTELTAAVTIPILAAGAAAVHFSTDFNRSMANVQSLIPQTQGRIEELRDAVRSISLQTGQRPSDLAQGLYQLISAFGDSADAAQLLDINARAAVGGVSTVGDAIAVTSAVTRAYGDTSAATVQKVADLALLAVRLGKTTFPDLAASIGRSTPLAAALNVAMEELFATMATGSGVTGDVSEVSTQLRGIFQALQAPTDAMRSLYEQLGVASGGAAVKQLGLFNVIKTVVQSAQASGRSLQEFIPQIEGQTLALSLAGAQADDYQAKLRQMQQAAGTTNAAFTAQTEGINASGHALELVARQFEQIAEKLGDALGPAILKSVPAITSVALVLLHLVESFSRLSQPTQEFILTLTAMALAFGPIIHVAGTLITTFAAVARTLLLARTAGLTLSVVFAVITSPVTLTIIAITALVALLVIFRDRITRVASVINEFVVGGLANLARKIPLIGDAVARVINILGNRDIVEQARAAGQKVGDAYTQKLSDTLKLPPRLPNAPVANVVDSVNQRAGPPKPIVIIDPQELNRQVQTAVDRLNLAREAGRSIAAPFRDLVRLQDQLNTRLQQGKLTIDDENQLTRALLNARKAIGDAAGTNVESISNKARLAIDALELARQQGGDLSEPMRQVAVIQDLINTRLRTTTLSLADQNALTRELVALQKSLAEAQKPDTRAFDAFKDSAQGALAQLQALKAASNFSIQVPTSDAGETLDRIIQQQFLLNGAGQQYERTLVDVRTAYANILGVIQSTANPTKEQIELARQLGAALEEAARRAVIKEAPVAVQNLLSQLNLAANSYAEAIAAFQLAREASDKAAANTAKKSAESFQDQAIKLQRQIATFASTLDPTTAAAVLERMRSLMKSMGVDMSNINTQTSRWLEKLGKVAQGFASVLQGVEGVLDAVGALDDSTRKVLEGLTKVAQNAPRAAAGDPAAILGVIGGIAQTIGGLFGGKSPEEKERDRIDRENQEILRRIARGVEDFSRITLSGQQFASLRDIFDSIVNAGAAGQLKDNTGLGNRVGAVLAANGFDIQDVKDAAQQLGLTFQNTAQFYKDFAAALKAVDLTSFQNSFTGQLEELQRSFTVFNITDPAEKLRRTLALLSDPDVGSPAIRKAFEGVDLTTAQGLQDFQKRLQDLFSNFQNLTPEDLGGLSAQQFLDQLATAAGLSQEALDALTNSINEANHEMLNVPTGFRQARAEFLAQADSVATHVDNPLVNLTQDSAAADLQSATQQQTSQLVTMTDLLSKIHDALTGREPTATGQASPEQRQVTGVVHQFNIAAGAITVQGGTKSPQQQADDLLNQLKLRAQATWGDTTRIRDI